MRLLSGVVNLTDQSGRSLVDERFEVYIVDRGECDIEEIAVDRSNGGKGTMEEDRM